MEEMQKKYGNPRFDVDRTGRKKTFLSRYSDFMTRLIRRPVIEKEKCIRCGICVSHCPVPGKAVGFKKGNTELRDIVDADLDKLVEDGTFAELAEKYDLSDMVCLGKEDESESASEAESAAETETESESETAAK